MTGVGNRLPIDRFALWTQDDGRASSGLHQLPLYLGIGPYYSVGAPQPVDRTWSVTLEWQEDDWPGSSCDLNPGSNELYPDETYYDPYEPCNDLQMNMFRAARLAAPVGDESSVTVSGTLDGANFTSGLDSDYVLISGFDSNAVYRVETTSAGRSGGEFDVMVHGSCGYNSVLRAPSLGSESTDVDFSQCDPGSSTDMWIGAEGRTGNWSVTVTKMDQSS